jgi:hypothetical protein
LNPAGVAAVRFREWKLAARQKRAARKILLIEETPGRSQVVLGRMYEWPFHLRHDGEDGGNTKMARLREIHF